MKEYARQKYKWDICHWGPPICLGGMLPPFESRRRTLMGFICLGEYREGAVQCSWRNSICHSGSYGSITGPICESAQDNIKRDISRGREEGGDSLPFRTAVRNILQHGRQQSADYAKRQHKQAIKPDWLFLRLWDLRACDWKSCSNNGFVILVRSAGVLTPNQTTSFD